MESLNFDNVKKIVYLNKEIEVPEGLFVADFLEELEIDENEEIMTIEDDVLYIHSKTGTKG